MYKKKKVANAFNENIKRYDYLYLETWFQVVEKTTDRAMHR